MRIAELPGGREFAFPDGTSDAQMDAIIRALVAAEAAAAQARAEVAMLRDRLDALIAAQVKPAGKQTAVAPVDMSPVVGELRAMRADLNEGLNKMVNAQLADTILVRDEITGEQTRSRKVAR